MDWPLTLVLILAGVLLMTTVGTTVPVRLRVKAKGHGELGKAWAFAVGAEFWVVRFTMAAAHGVDGVLQLHVAQKRVVHLSPIRKRKLPAPAPAPDDAQAALRVWRARLAKVERWFELDQVVAFLVRQLAHVRVHHLEGNLVYSTPDVAYTGMICGVLYSMAGLMAPFGQLRVEPKWDDVASAQGDIDLAFRVWPGRILLNAMMFTMRNIKLRDSSTRAVVPAHS